MWIGGGVGPKVASGTYENIRNYCCFGMPVKTHSVLRQPQNITEIVEFHKIPRNSLKILEFYKSCDFSEMEPFKTLDIP